MKYMRKLYGIALLLALGLGFIQEYFPTMAQASSYTFVQQQLPEAINGLLPNLSGTLDEDAELYVSEISVVDKNNLWAVGHMIRPNAPTIDTITKESSILHSSNGGRTWEKLLADSEHYFFDVYFVNTQVGWICGGDGFILKSMDGGKKWIRQYAPTKSALIEIQFVDSNYGWAIGEDGEVLRTTDGGLHWSSHRIKVHGWIRLLNFSNRLNGWIAGEEGQAYQSTDGGVSWKSRGAELIGLLDNQQSGDVRFQTVKFINSEIGFIAAYVTPKKQGEFYAKGVVFKTEDAGRSWTVSVVTKNVGLKTAEFVSNLEAWIVPVYSDYLLHTQDGGKSWNNESNLNHYDVIRIYFADSKNGWLITSDEIFRGHLFCTNDGGKSWIKLKLLGTYQ